MSLDLSLVIPCFIDIDLEAFRAFAEREGASQIAFEPGWRNAIAVFEGQS
jgi:hypothetical protein